MIIYGGTKERVEQQLTCQHDWHGPCIDSISRYYKCTKCFCIERDCTEEEYYAWMKEEYKTVAQAWEDFVDAIGYNDFVWGLMQRMKKVLTVLTKIASNKAMQKSGADARKN